ncbi:LysR family transcriptional regulator [Silvimonas iriomotensis]|uniref:LysR family transcriptional regulator n=1 Tax=Silvimonas iriomotensis TaxID=449662 RepID=A0ABQ2P577_9NEIS|nr:LysR family transcriptional regulator [Silvimonas iriomotensis]GGP18487.1 LysR family transcriptional regulator [Silvimonas iriomotensis]
MDRLLAMQTFARVVETGSFVRAAEKLDMSTSAVSRLVADLESHLNARLLQRTTRRLSLTDAGRAYYERTLQILSDVAEAEADVGSEASQPSGWLRFTAPLSLGTRHLADVLPGYCAQFPQVHLDVSLSDRAVDLVEEGLDMGLRIAAQLPGSYVARRIAPIRIVACAAPGYLVRHGTPKVPADLRNHRALSYSYFAEGDTWNFEDAQQRKVPVQIKPVFRANNGDILTEAAKAGEGVIIQPTFLVGEDLRAGRLVQILPGYTLPEMSLQAIYPSRRHLSAKVRSLVDYLQQKWGETPPWDCWMQGSESTDFPTISK